MANGILSRKNEWNYILSGLHHLRTLPALDVRDMALATLKEGAMTDLVTRLRQKPNTLLEAEAADKIELLQQAHTDAVQRWNIALHRVAELEARLAELVHMGAQRGIGKHK